MLKDIAQELKKVVDNYSSEDQLIFKGKIIPIDERQFSEIHPSSAEETVCYIDGGQAEILQAANFCLSFIRVGAAKFSGGKRLGQELNEFYVLVSAHTVNGDLIYSAKIFQQKGDQLVTPEMLTISSQDASIKSGSERAPIQKVAQMARRFAELNYAKKLSGQGFANNFVLDGALDASYKGEEEVIASLPSNVAALAKSSSLFTHQGNSPTILLSNIGPVGKWAYTVEGNTSFVKLHNNAKHVFRFEGDAGVLGHMISNAVDPIFLGYPYGLILVDKIARVSNQERESLRVSFLLDKENEKIITYLNTSNAHDILDRIG